jgi:hypothetical protein
MNHKKVLIGLYLLFQAASLNAAPADPFAGVSAREPAQDRAGRSFFGENFGFRREIFSQFAASKHSRPSSRQSAGFEVLKKFSTETATFAGLNFQGRLVRRDRFVPVMNDMEGAERPDWWFEVHNAYLDLYNLLGPAGRLNARAGRFYVPFGINLQTDTHGTVLQLSNERNFGFERDWYAGLWGSVNEHVNYDAHYLLGSGYHPEFKGQSGLGALRLSLGSRHSFEQGLEGGLSALGGERLNKEFRKIQTRRGGIDGRIRRSVPTGLAAATAEISGGRDDNDSVVMQLYQGEYLHASRRWGLSGQFRRFWQEGLGGEASVIGEASWYFRNDVGNSNLHWIKINVEKQVETANMPSDVIVALQYYRYW